jgi:hypothetical protein
VTVAGLKTLGDYGGLTQTMMLQNTSPALDIIPAAATLCTNSPTDQRGISRPQSGNCDSGAVEARPATVVITPDPRQLPDAALSTPTNANVAVSNSGDLDTQTPSTNVAAPFSTSGCTSPIAAGSSCILGVQFAPTVGGKVSRVLQVTAGSASDTATVFGIGWAPTSPPQIQGIPSVGYQASVATGRWPPTVASFSAQWMRCDSGGLNCSDIPGATRTGYQPVLADEGQTLRVRLIARSTTGVDSDPVTTAASAVVTRTVPTLIQSPVIERSSSPTVGTRLQAKRGEWTGAPDSVAFQWIVCDADGTSNCVDIPGQTTNHYKPLAGDTGHTLRVRVVATNPAGSSAPATSPPSGVVS